MAFPSGFTRYFMQAMLSCLASLFASPFCETARGSLAHSISLQSNQTLTAKSPDTNLHP